MSRVTVRVFDSIVVNGITHEPGGVVHMDSTEVASYGDSVSLDLASPYRDSHKARTAGAYTLLDGDVFSTQGSGHPTAVTGISKPGDTIRLSADDACALGDRVS
ncbi:MAG: hypothetical protein JW940_02680 [Polyangiaceae bacterium]|nr:hypothetical protein [Polyangiaceae bacterium]